MIPNVTNEMVASVIRARDPWITVYTISVRHKVQLILSEIF